MQEFSNTICSLFVPLEDDSSCEVFPGTESCSQVLSECFQETCSKSVEKIIIKLL